MNIPSKEKTIDVLERYLGVQLNKIPGKQILFHGTFNDQRELVVCTPESKLYPKGFGWIDITSIQYALLDQKKSILAFRLPHERVYYLMFEDLKTYLTKKSLLNNVREGDHWKIHIWPEHFQILGNDNIFPIVPNVIENIKI
jgi:hypothetical protein